MQMRKIYCFRPFALDAFALDESNAFALDESNANGRKQCKHM